MTGYDELPGSPRISFNEGQGHSAERLFLVNWGSIEAFAQDLAAQPTAAFPGLSHMRAQGITAEPFSPDLPPSGVVTDPKSQIVVYAQNGGKVALIRVSYGPVFYNKTWPTDVPKPSFRAGTQIRLRMRASGQFVTIPGRMMLWSSGSGSPGEEEAANAIPTPPDLNARLINVMKEINVQWDFVDDPPLDALDEKLGHVFDAEFFGCPAETLLFEGYDLDDSFKLSPANTHTNRLNLIFRKRVINGDGGPFGWNHEYRENPAGWTRIIMADGTPRYPTVSPTNFFA